MSTAHWAIPFQDQETAERAWRILHLKQGAGAHDFGPVGSAFQCAPVPDTAHFAKAVHAQGLATDAAWRGTLSIYQGEQVYCSPADHKASSLIFPPDVEVFDCFVRNAVEHALIELEKVAAAPAAVWRSHDSNDGMRFPEQSDLMGGATDCCAPAAPVAAPTTKQFPDRITDLMPTVGPPEDPLQGAVNWLVEAVVDCGLSDIQRRLHIGYNRASRLLEIAKAKATATSRGDTPS